MLQVSFQCLQHFDIYIRIHAPHPAPILGEAHSDRSACRSVGFRGFTQQHTYIHELTLHPVRDIPHQEELALPASSDLCRFSSHPVLTSQTCFRYCRPSWAQSTSSHLFSIRHSSTS